MQTADATVLLNADETGWRIGILNAWLWVFSNKEITVYTIRSGEGARGHKVAVDILGDRFEGVLISDCLAVYDVEAFSQCIKQKCLNHFLTNLCPLREDTQAIVTAFANEAVQTLKQAIELKKSKPDLNEQAYQQQCQAVEQRLDDLLKEYAQMGNETAQRLVNRLNKQRKNLLIFLYQENVEATNAQAERDLRPAVIARKTQACNKTTQGADNHSILSSIMSTARKQSVPIIELLEKVQRGKKTSLVFAPNLAIATV